MRPHRLEEHEYYSKEWSSKLCVGFVQRIIARRYGAFRTTAANVNVDECAR